VLGYFWMNGTPDIPQNDVPPIWYQSSIMIYDIDHPLGYMISIIHYNTII
jgi:hypothetical protein